MRNNIILTPGDNMNDFNQKKTILVVIVTTTTTTTSNHSIYR